MSSALHYDFSKLLINPADVPKGKRLVDHFPELNAFAEFKQQQDDNIIKISVFTADADSPFLKMRADRELMIKSIFDFLEIGVENKKGKDFFKKVVEYKHEGVAECWYAYLKMQLNIDFNEWAMTKQTYDMLLSESNRQRDTDETMEKYANWRVKMRDQIRLVGKDLKEIEAIVFKDSKMARPVALVVIRKIKNYPEKYAQKGVLM